MVIFSTAHADQSIEKADPMDKRHKQPSLSSKDADLEMHAAETFRDHVGGGGGRGGTQRRLRNYQVTMIGFCGGIGTGLFIGTGVAYAHAGPAGLLLAYIIVAGVLWSVMQSIAELATVFPVAGTFPHWATRFIDPAWVSH
jgi:amino acid transporter